MSVFIQIKLILLAIVDYLNRFLHGSFIFIDFLLKKL